MNNYIRDRELRIANKKCNHDEMDVDNTLTTFQTIDHEKIYLCCRICKYVYYERVRSK